MRICIFTPKHIPIFYKIVNLNQFKIKFYNAYIFQNFNDLKKNIKKY